MIHSGGIGVSGRLHEGGAAEGGGRRRSVVERVMNSAGLLIRAVTCAEDDLAGLACFST
jgi:hypothetical protein